MTVIVSCISYNAITISKPSETTKSEISTTMESFDAINSELTIEIPNQRKSIEIEAYHETLQTIEVISRSFVEPTQTVAPTPKPTAKPTPKPTSTKPTTSEINEFYRVVSLEAFPNSYDGCLAVATVIMNRVERNNSSILSVLSAKSQFSTWSDKNYSRITSTVKNAVNDAVAGKRSLPANCLYFCADYAFSNSSSKIIYSKIGGNTFYGYK